MHSGPRQQRRAAHPEQFYGWGKIAKDLGYKNLGSVLKSVKSAGKDVDRVAKADDKHTEKIGKTEKVEKMDKPGRIERIERPERAERPGR